jgi:hypothetical protein
MATQRVRTHTRKTADGGTTTVRQHARTGRDRRPLLSPGHALKLAKKARAHSKRKRGAMAVTVGAMAVGEMGAWLTLRGVFLLLGTAALLALGVAVLAGTATGMGLPDGAPGRFRLRRSQAAPAPSPAKPARPRPAAAPKPATPRPARPAAPPAAPKVNQAARPAQTPRPAPAGKTWRPPAAGSSMHPGGGR